VSRTAQQYSSADDSEKHRTGLESAATTAMTLKPQHITQNYNTTTMHMFI